ncbi:hypothetical protein B0H14DRAFT_2568773 [Mycena olivaceomarginata]|nr:hypothetical protein B0H14DRAFT_2568773 [Mycena olivaceomarginata]
MPHIWDLWLLKTITNTHSCATNPTHCGKSHGVQGTSQQMNAAAVLRSAVGVLFSSASPSASNNVSAFSTVHSKCGTGASSTGSSILRWEGTGHGREEIKFAQVGREWEWEFEEGAEQVVERQEWERDAPHSGQQWDIVLHPRPAPHCHQPPAGVVDIVIKYVFRCVGRQRQQAGGGIGSTGGV